MSKSTLDQKRHSLAHLLAAAVAELWPDTKNTIGPVIDNGFYYDFEFINPITETDLPTLEQKMKELYKSWQTFEELEVTAKESKKIFATNPYKIELIEELAKAGEKITHYRSGNFVDLCRGGHVNKMTDIEPGSWKLDRLAGAYWRGDEKNKMLTRIYGLAFDTKKELADYLQMIEEAKKRDHRKLGRELDLFHLDEIVGLGLPLWHPKGALLWRLIEDFWYKKHLDNGYDLVRSPHIGNRILWETSGHWGFYNKSMYPPLEVGQTLEEKQQNKKIETPEEYLLKPMNCPFHVQIYKNHLRSYRELPLRWAECGTVYRYEKKGELTGLVRVRGFTQDDAHIVCKKDQVEDELKRVIDFILFMYESFGFAADKVSVHLSLRNPDNKEKYAGNDDGWEFTETVLRKIAQDKKLSFKEELGEAAFYGPKLDFKIKDVIGRDWQCSTLQFDFNLPERFNMVFINKEGKEEQPYMLHRALFGSFERFIGLLIENYAGAFPTWLAPVQIKLLPVGSTHHDYCQKLKTDLAANGFRVELDDANETIGNKIRKAEGEKIPYSLVIGDKEISNGQLAVRLRGKKELLNLTKEQLIDRINQETTGRRDIK